MKKRITAGLALIISATVAQASVVTAGATTLLSSLQNDVGSAVIDLTAGSATASGTSYLSGLALGDGTISEYLFVNAVGVSDTSAGSLNVLTSSGASISTPTFPALSLGGSKANVALTLPDGTTVFTANTGAAASDASGTIETSGYKSGTVYFIFGTSADYAQVSFDGAISGFLGSEDSGDAFDTTGTSFDFSGTAIGVNGTAIAAFTFDNTADSFADTLLDYRAINTDYDGSRARFYGIIIDGVSVIPEPATIGMLGLGALITLLIRRWRS
jgi:hypothetical protein